jgi:AcrR family transcriptional regulator
MYFCREKPINIMTESIKTRIIEKAAELYNRVGIKSITMDDVARELGISKKTLYQYVSDKKELVSEVCDYEMGKKRKAFMQIQARNHNAIEEIIEVNKLILHLIKEYNPTKFYDLKKYYPDIYAKMRRDQRENMFRSMIANLRKGKEEGLFREDLDEVVIAKLYISRVEYPLESDLLSPEEFLSPRFIIQSFIYHIHGIANERGLILVKEYMDQIRQNDDYYDQT